MGSSAGVGGDLFPRSLPCRIPEVLQLVGVGRLSGRRRAAPRTVKRMFETPYRLRKQVVEPVFGQIKQARGFRQFLLRGVDKVRAEWAMICTAHNLLKLFNLKRNKLISY